MERKESVFTGTMIGWLGMSLATYFLSVITFGLAFPWLMCWMKSWECEHTYIEGRQLHFDGTGLELIGNWIKWLLLGIITLGIYFLWVPVKVMQWQVKHTHFSDSMSFMGELPNDYGGTAAVGNRLEAGRKQDGFAGGAAMDGFGGNGYYPDDQWGGYEQPSLVNEAPMNNVQAGSRNYQPAMQQSSITLCAKNSALAGSRWRSHGETLVIGRQSGDCQIQFPDDTHGVSRRHCQIMLTQQGWAIQDLNSKFGTYVRGRKLEPYESYPLNSGDDIMLASERIRINVERIQ